MTARNYHTPPQPGSARARCPVCHEAVYSRAGIHPQCAVRQSEPPRAKATPQAPADDLAGEPAADAGPAIEAVEAPAVIEAPPSSRRRPA